MEYFHGSIKKGLSALKPNASPFSNSKEPLVYLTTSRQLALHYIWDMDRIGVKMPMLDIHKDGTLVFQEMFSGALEYFYKGVSGYIYRCPCCTFIQEKFPQYWKEAQVLNDYQLL